MVSVLQSLRPGRAGGDRDAAADDGVAAQVARDRVIEVHRTAAPAAPAVAQAHDLSQGLGDSLLHLVREIRLARVVVVGCIVDQGLGEKVPVRAVGGGNHVRLVQGDGHCRGHGLLPDAGVHRPVDQVLVLELQDQGLKLADQVEQQGHPRQVARRDALQVLGRGLKQVAGGGGGLGDQFAHRRPPEGVVLRIAYSVGAVLETEYATRTTQYSLCR